MADPASFWYVPLTAVTDEEKAVALSAVAEVTDTVLNEFSAPKLYSLGVRSGDVLALLVGAKVKALARVLVIDNRRQLVWSRLELETAPLLNSEPVLSAVPATEAAAFRLGINALLQDVRRPMPLPAGNAIRPQNVLLYGAPGTGKTYSTKERAIRLAIGDAGWEDAKGRKDKVWEELIRAGRVVFCTFHQAFAYEEFIEGLRPELGGDGKGEVTYTIEAGVFKRLALVAMAAGLKLGGLDEKGRMKASIEALKVDTSFDFSQAEQYVLVIDEINRANVARVFGELISLLEEDKRLGGDDPARVRLPASGEWFAVPPNLHVIGTLNTADRSIALMDVALRRRFSFEELRPNEDILRAHLSSKSVPEPIVNLTLRLFNTLNLRLRYLYDREHQIGHAWFMKVRSVEDLRDVFARKILPLLQEYFYGHWDKVALTLGHPRKEGGAHFQMVVDSTIPTVLLLTRMEEKAILGFDHEDYEDQQAWEFHPHFRGTGSPGTCNLRWTVEALVSILQFSDPAQKQSLVEAIVSLPAPVAA